MPCDAKQSIIELVHLCTESLFTCEDGLVDSERGGEDLGETDVGGHLVTNCNHSNEKHQYKYAIDA